MKKSLVTGLILIFTASAFLAAGDWEKHEEKIKRVAEELGQLRYEDFYAVEMELEDPAPRSANIEERGIKLEKSEVPPPPKETRSEKKSFFSKLFGGIKRFFSNIFSKIGSFFQSQEAPDKNSPEYRTHLAEKIKELYNKYKIETLRNGKDTDRAKKILSQYTELCKEYENLRISEEEKEPDYFMEEISLPSGGIQISGFYAKLKRAFSGGKITLDDVALNFRETFSNDLEPLAGRDAFWTSLVRDIKTAKSSINIHIFGMRADKWGWEFARILAEKSRQGVEIKILADLYGARMTWYRRYASRRLFDFYRENGVDFVFYKASLNPFNSKFLHFDHRKYFIIDGKIAYNTGYTIERHMREEMFDIGVKARGPIVNQIQASFFLNYFSNGGKARQRNFGEFYRKFFPASSNPGNMHAHLAINVPNRQHRITESYYQKISNARKSVYVINPYFTDNRIVKSLIRAKENGAEVNVILPYNPENPLNSKNTTYHAWQLAKRGVKVHLFLGPEKFGRLHAKGILVDDEFVSIGSCNMDKMALYQNYEQNIESRDAKFAEKTKKNIFEYAMKYSAAFRQPQGFFETAQIITTGAFSGLFDFIS